MLDILLVFIPIAKSGKMNGVQPATTSQNGYKTPLMRSAASTMIPAHNFGTYNFSSLGSFAPRDLTRYSNF